MMAVDALNHAREALISGRVQEGMTLLSTHLSEVRASVPRPSWLEFIETKARTHAIAELLQQDPFTAHSFRQPRGYPGDAELLDYAYFELLPSESTSPLGMRIYEYTVETGAPRSVRARRGILASYIDETSAQFESATVASIACGHLREAVRAQSVIQGRVKRLIALDQDASSLSHAKRAIGHYCSVETINASIRALLVGKAVLPHKCHLVYAAGLFDYLGDRVARRLLQVMFDSVVDGGRVLIGNFAPSVRDIGYMEAYMKWHLLYRTVAEVEELANILPENRVASKRVFLDEFQHVAYLEITKK